MRGFIYPFSYLFFNMAASSNKMESERCIITALYRMHCRHGTMRPFTCAILNYLRNYSTKHAAEHAAEQSAY